MRKLNFETDSRSAAVASRRSGVAFADASEGNAAVKSDVESTAFALAPSRPDRRRRGNGGKAYRFRTQTLAIISDFLETNSPPATTFSFFLHFCRFFLFLADFRSFPDLLAEVKTGARVDESFFFVVRFP